MVPRARCCRFDLAGYGTASLEVRPETGVAHIAGWSDKVFDVLSALNDGGSALTKIGKTCLVKPV